MDSSSADAALAAQSVYPGQSKPEKKKPMKKVIGMTKKRMKGKIVGSDD